MCYELQKYIHAGAKTLKDAQKDNRFIIDNPDLVKSTCLKIQDDNFHAGIFILPLKLAEDWFKLVYDVSQCFCFFSEQIKDKSYFAAIIGNDYIKDFYANFKHLGFMLEKKE
jgi:hypothetical protein